MIDLSSAILPPAPPAIVIVVARPGAAHPGRHRRPIDHRGPRVPQRHRRTVYLPRTWRPIPRSTAMPRPAIHAGELTHDGLAKSARWMVLGGHGRNGAG